MIIDDSLTPMEVGKAGELRVAFELLIRGLKPAVFYSDDGTDIILANGKKIGVKTVKRAHVGGKQRQYSYTISFGTVKVGKINGVWKRTFMKRDFTNFVDYWIVWLIEHNVFYIMPNGIQLPKMSITFELPDNLRKNARFKNYKSRSKYEKYKNNWEQLR